MSRKSEDLQIRITPEQKTTLKKRAARVGQDVSGSEILRLVSLGFVALLGTLSLSCSEGERGGQVAARDSAGIRIVENPAPSGRIPRLTVSNRPEAWIGSREGEDGYLFYGVIDARSFGNGGILVADAGNRRIVGFDATGRVIFSAGGTGEGPSEFSGLVAVGILPGDTIVALDRGRPSEIKRFDPNGRFLGARPFTRFGVAMSQLADGSWVGLAFAGERPLATPRTFREDWHLVRYGEGGNAHDTLGVVPGEYYYRNSGGGSTRVPAGSAQLAARGGVIAAASSATYEIRVFEASGVLRMILRNTLPNPPMGDTVGAGALSTISDPPDQWALAPAFHELAVDTGERVWVRRSADSVDPAEWHVYDRDGHLTAVVELPDRFRPTEITSSAILGVLRDELDVEYVVRYAYDSRLFATEQ